MSQNIGRRLGPYEILALIGAGGMGEVYRVRDTRLDRVVALKILPSHTAHDPTARARFDREARAIAGLSHPNICALFDVGHDQGHPFLVMELLEGQTLQQRLLGGAFELQDFVEVAEALADALDTAHSHGIIHRDLKPANIFITSRGVPKILDFGLAKGLGPSDLLDDDETQLADAALTSQGTTVGTVAYMSPEQLRGERVDARTDLFSLGLVFYEMVTGQRAFTGATSPVVSAGILWQQPAAPRSLRPDLPQRVEDTILKAIEKDRNVRCQSAAELRADLMRIKREPASTPPVPPAPARVVGAAPASASGVAAPGSATSRGPAWLAAVILLVAAVLVGAYWQSRRSVPPASPEATATAPPVPAAPPSPTPPPITPPLEPVGQAPQQTPAQAAPTASTAGAAESPADARLGAGGTAAASRGRNGRGGFGPAAATLIAALRNLPPQPFHIVYAADSPQSLERARQLNAILIEAGWTSSGIAPGRDLPAIFRIGVPRLSRSAAALNSWATRSGFVTGYRTDYRVLPNLTEIHLVVPPLPK